MGQRPLRSVASSTALEAPWCNVAKGHEQPVHAATLRAAGHTRRSCETAGAPCRSGCCHFSTSAHAHTRERSTVSRLIGCIFHTRNKMSATCMPPAIWQSVRLTAGGEGKRRVTGLRRHLDGNRTAVSDRRRHRNVAHPRRWLRSAALCGLSPRQQLRGANGPGPLLRALSAHRPNEPDGLRTRESDVARES